MTSFCGPPPPACPPAAVAPRLGPHHFAHLRAVAEGLSIAQSAKRFLGIDHGHQAKNAHLQTMDAVRAIARRRAEPAWRLIGLTIRPQPGQAHTPSLDEFMAERGLDGWSEAEIRQMHSEAWPPDPRAARRSRLRERQLDLLRRLQALAAEVPLAGDLVSGWFDEVTAGKLMAAGLPSLGELAERILRGGRWYAALPAVGRAKAGRIASHLTTLLPEALATPRPVFGLPGCALSTAAPNTPKEAGGQGARSGSGLGLGSVAVASSVAAPLEPAQPSSPQGFIQAWPESQPYQPFSHGEVPAKGGAETGPIALALAHNPAQPPAPGASLLQASSDAQAVQAWIAARAGSVATARVYQREATRLLLWLEREAGGKTLREMRVADCTGFMAFLQHIPAQWISRQRAAPGEQGWAPFRGPLSQLSQKQAVVINASLFTWLQAAQYLSANPWLLVNQKTGDDRERKMLDTKALSESASEDILRFLDAQAPSPSRERMRFIFRFVQSVGLRSAELLGARLGDFQHEPEGWVMQVHGKGAKNRIAAVPGQALSALQDYLQARGLGCVETAPPAAPLLASTLDALAPLGYQALYEHVRRWLAKAVRASSLPEREREKLLGATTHWLRHTFGTRAIAREVPLDVIQAQMGHASIQTTTAIYGRAPIRRRVDELGKAFK